MTPKQEKFCQLYIEWGNASQAYREAYNADTMKADTIHRKAKELLDNGKITARLNELKRTQYERHNITVDKILAELEQARIIALESQNAPAMINATMAKVKLLGLDKKTQLAINQLDEDKEATKPIEIKIIRAGENNNPAH